MAINAYTGLMGSGKSYEVVENVILPALASGRRVVTNVANLQINLIAAHLTEVLLVDPSKHGVIVQCQNDDLNNIDFFPPEHPPEGIFTSMVLPGDLVVIDECWRWWAQGSKISAQHMAFFRMHRHFTNPETGVSCDLVLVVQDIGDLDRKLKAVIESTYRMTKHKALGSVTRYRVDIYQGNKITRSPTRSIQRKYNKAIFPLYKSYSHGDGKGNEVEIDSRNNIFKSPIFRILLPLALLCSIYPIYFIYRFFSPKVVDSVPASSSSVSASAPALSPPPVLPDSDWRVIGHYSYAGRFHVVLFKAGSTRILINPPGWYSDPLRSSGVLDGKLVTTYTGSLDTPSFNKFEQFKK